MIIRINICDQAVLDLSLIHIYYSVDSDFNGVSGTSNGSSITDQIEAAYQNNCLKDASELLTPERAKVLFDQDSDWENMTPEEFKAALELAKEQADESGIDADYAKEQLAQLEQAANADESIYRILDKYDIPNTIANLLAMESMLNQRNQMFRKIFGSSMACLLYTSRFLYKSFAPPH